MNKYKETECSCQKCKDMCRKRVCWPTPEEADKLIDAGFSNRLMEDYWADEEDIMIICPAIKGYEGEFAPWWPTGGCCLQDKDGLCILHDLGLKPLEGRIADCKETEAGGRNIHEEIAMMWEGDCGKAVVEKWQYKIKEIK